MRWNASASSWFAMSQTGRRFSSVPRGLHRCRRAAICSRSGRGSSRLPVPAPTNISCLRYCNVRPSSRAQQTGGSAVGTGNWCTAGVGQLSCSLPLVAQFLSALAPLSQVCSGASANGWSKPAASATCPTAAASASSRLTIPEDTFIFFLAWIPLRHCWWGQGAPWTRGGATPGRARCAALRLFLASLRTLY